MRTDAIGPGRSPPRNPVPDGFLAETLRWRVAARSPEPSSQGGSVGSNPFGATNQNPLRRKGFCACRGEDSATPIRARDTPGTHQGGQVPFLCLHA